MRFWRRRKRRSGVSDGTWKAVGDVLDMVAIIMIWDDL